MSNHPMEEKWKEEFDKEFLYWVVLGSTLNDGSELRWNVGDGKLPDIEKIKSFIENLLEQERKRMSEEGKRMWECLRGPGFCLEETCRPVGIVNPLETNPVEEMPQMKGTLRDW